MDSNIQAILQQQRQFFANGKTKSLEFRLTQLKKLQAALLTNEELILDAIKQDLHRPKMEAVISEFLITIEEIKLVIKNLAKWMQPEKVGSPFPLVWPGKSSIISEPYGTAFVIGAWNYPIQLTLVPMIGAMAAGNCVVVKPSEIATHSQDVLCKIITETFSPEYVAVIKAEPEAMPSILQEKFDYIFFTGGTQIGKIIMEAAAKHLTPLTLELGGKSPCIVDATANLAYAARRIVWSKFMNAGQTCIAPDYLLVQESCKQEFIKHLLTTCKKFYGEHPAVSDSYSRIINEKHFLCLQKLLTKGKIILGGETNQHELFIAPTLIDDVTLDDPIMQEEIFGPILPILTFNQLADALEVVKAHPNPLSLYAFTNDAETETAIKEKVAFGGGCFNDCIIQFANYRLPFGGIGNSGLGKYHGRYSFDTFSNRKSIFKRSWSLDFSFMYPPYKARNLNFLRWLTRLK